MLTPSAIRHHANGDLEHCHGRCCSDRHHKCFGKHEHDDAISQGTSDISLLATAIQKDTSTVIRNHIANYLDKAIGICSTST
ncbi:hypothetical protein M427DRAFT_132915 [Gonapodya prolifera JEL478]|uniref:Uncharacterized protein n=1 Tax=Gonapodya prolifera (strain JEL478) TaxID=1344416 RepID=A0A139AN34_GONPJ|nr:hypothetical protein M427DRAFT_132915 [Gonapodya prolifera JEL478]|eukprot:KXS18152.1 hypothetical protein M427DRAFT_132915 [Gonapodya prolifera JEL478]